MEAAQLLPTNIAIVVRGDNEDQDLQGMRPGMPAVFHIVYDSRGSRAISVGKLADGRRRLRFSHYSQ
jgi:hypothetical protein